MKRNALVAFGLLVSLVSAGAVFGKEVKNVNNVAIAKQFGITVEQARKNALKKVPGEIEDEYTIEDDDGNLTTYVFVIKASSNGKNFDVQIDAQNGNVLAADEQEEAEVESTDDEESTETEEMEEDETESEEMEDAESTEPTETEEVESTDTDEADEIESNETESTVSDDDDDTDEVLMKDDTPTFKVSMAQAREKAVKKAKGEIQSESLVTDDGSAYYAFTIKGKKDKMTEVHVDANSGKAKKIKASKSE